ncbi:Undecaprenyl-phosphate glucose phosphotransferase [Silvibacterium bohemicum]|uniref:Undecaprenyl-phosphate glucose phosphotransferase n=1 Tax=Silvibacterium bohemicum TaxID=1577686 RepID=A0A841JPD1_9BACT|nr:undecaprenyl-phosphate glucose phosphotransferase [Silvibacterium bohemicum]MBB6143206.1 Undecaprenyl-phosphate glucose phosphotransferase [Silvibacterium bohemicum]
MSASIAVNLVQLSDILILLLCGLLSRILLLPKDEHHVNGLLFFATLVGSVLTTRVLARADAYTPSSLRSWNRQSLLLMKPLLFGAGSIIICIFLMGGGQLLRRWLLVWFGLSLLFLIVYRSFLSQLFRRWMEAGRLARRVAVIGAGELSREFIDRLRAEPHAYTVVGLYDDRLSRVPAMQDGVEVRGTVQNLLERSREEQIDVIVIALPLSAAERIGAILEQVRSTVADVCLTTDFAGLRYRSDQISKIGSNPVVLMEERPLKDWRGAKKLAFDLVVGSLLIVLSSPILALIALLIRLDSPGPIIFRQPRLGFNNRLFTCYKFRTMRTDMTDLLADQQTTRDDPRVTRLGKWLRMLSFDELPQLFNVIRGDMSLVGPRPHAPNTKAADRLYTDVVAKYALRHRVKPGITGWAQVNGWRGQTKKIEQIENRVACDLDYIENWSIWFDVRILVLTITREMLSSNAF